MAGILEELQQSWGAIVSVLTISAFVVSSYVYIDNTYFEKREAEALEARVKVASSQTVQNIQEQILAIRLNQYQWELQDINLRIKHDTTLPGDLARKLQLEEQIKQIVQAMEKLQNE